MTKIKKACKDCGSTSRALPHPGPRCATCQRAFRKASLSKAHDAYVARTYNLSRGFYELLYDSQEGRCAICQAATGKAKRLAVDHDHAHCGTGCPECVRGLLCGPCNIMIGRLGRDSLRRALAYLRHPPARRVVKFMREEES